MPLLQLVDDDAWRTQFRIQWKAAQSDFVYVTLVDNRGSTTHDMFNSLAVESRRARVIKAPDRYFIVNQCSVIYLDSNCVTIIMARLLLAPLLLLARVAAIPADPQFFAQRVDHFNEQSAETYQQRYYINDTAWAASGPILLILGGEGAVPPSTGERLASGLRTATATNTSSIPLPTLLCVDGVQVFSTRASYYSLRS